MLSGRVLEPKVAERDDPCAILHANEVPEAALVGVGRRLIGAGRRLIGWRRHASILGGRLDTFRVALL